MSLSESIQPKSVAIIGGGLGGLTLAQALRHSGFKVTVYERDQTSDARAQGFLIGLQRDLGIKALRSLNLPHLSSFLDDVPGRGFSVLDAKLRLLARFGRPTSAKEVPTTFLLDRWRLRSLLTQDLDIVWGKKFDHYEEHQEQVHIFFEDGSSASATFLVGADGGNSKIRAQKCPTLRLETIPVYNAGGIAGLDDVKEEEIPTLTSLAKLDGLRILGKKFGYSFLVMSWTSPTQANQLIWALTYPKDCPLTEKLQGRDRPDVIKAALTEAAQEFHQDIQILVAKTPLNKMDIHTYYSSTVFDMKSKNPYSHDGHRSRVTLLGDAAHVMTSHRGLGANTALEDAVELAAALVKPNWQEVLEEYEMKMFVRGSRAVRESKESSNGLVIKGWRASLRDWIFWLIGCALSVYERLSSLRF